MTITYDPKHPKYLDEKDVRDKNKKKRYEVRQQVEITTRQEGLAE